MQASLTVSIIMPAFNAEQTITTSIDSVLNQDFKDWELIIINDGSTDKTLDIINLYTHKDQRIKLVNQNNLGLPKTRNNGIFKAKGKFIAFLDADDLWLPNKLSYQIDFHQRNPAIKISHTAYSMFNKKGMIRTPIREYFSFLYPVRRTLIPSIYKRNTIGILTVMVERDLLLKVKGFDCELWTMEDHDLWIRIAKLNEPFGFLKKNLSLYRISASGMTNEIGKYKKAYKTLINKHKESIISYQVLDVTMANYYCLFGASYLKRGSNKMANLYFFKAIKTSFFSFTGIISMINLVLQRFIISKK